MLCKVILLLFRDLEMNNNIYLSLTTFSLSVQLVMDLVFSAWIYVQSIKGIKLSGKK